MDGNWHWQQYGKAWRGVGIYHLTLVVPSREPLLGELKIPDSDPAQAFVERSELGKAVIHDLAQISERHPDIKLLQYCLMPNHVHAILHVTAPMPQGILAVVRGFWQGEKKIGRAYSMSITPHSMRENEHTVDPLFREMPFVRPLSRSGQLNTMVNYLILNPQRLATKLLKPGFFRVQDGIEIAGRTYSGVGNAKLLQERHFAYSIPMAV